MVVPGPSPGGEAALPSNVLEIALPAKTELRFSVPHDEPGARLVVTAPPGPPSASGPGSRHAAPLPCRVEVFGAPLLPGNRYDLPPGSRIAVFAWTAATVRLEGSAVLRGTAHRALASSVPVAAELHCALHRARDAAQRATLARERVGPRVVVCGGRATGKHALVRTLCNYAARFGWQPTVLDCSLETQMFALPGSVGLACWELPATVDEGVANLLQIAFFCGFLSAQSFVARGGDAGVSYPISPSYLATVDAALQLLKGRLVEHAVDIAGPSGAFVVVPSLAHAEGVDFVARIVDELDATHVVCLGDDYMFAQLRERYVMRDSVASAATTGRLLFARKAGGPLVIDRMSGCTGAECPTERQAKDILARRVQEYFRGTQLRTVFPTSHTIERRDEWADTFDRIYVFARGGRSVVRVAPEELESIQHKLGALYDLPPGAGEATLLGTPMLSFIYILRVDLRGAAAQLSFLSVCPIEGLPKRPTIVIGEVMWLS